MLIYHQAVEKQSLMAENPLISTIKHFERCLVDANPFQMDLISAE
ncbi:hypothetical protein [Calidifontibacillus erzurumensis]|nr:hypothetical protein [Calidifontibacillus erzurumensis]